LKQADVLRWVAFAVSAKEQHVIFDCILADESRMEYPELIETIGDGDVHTFIPMKD